jgi:hypothetical protein
MNAKDGRRPQASAPVGSWQRREHPSGGTGSVAGCGGGQQTSLTGLDRRPTVGRTSLQQHRADAPSAPPPSGTRHTPGDGRPPGSSSMWASKARAAERVARLVMRGLPGSCSAGGDVGRIGPVARARALCLRICRRMPSASADARAPRGDIIAVRQRILHCVASRACRLC